MTDEMVPDGDDDNWCLKPLLVEVKHRVGRLQVPPPFYDQLQACTYCLMLGVDAADLVQCVRSSRSESQIHVTRIRLDEAPLFHGQAWRTHVLPRLYAFADAVHKFRADRRLRHAYMLGDDETRDALLADALPHISW